MIFIFMRAQIITKIGWTVYEHVKDPFAMLNRVVALRLFVILGTLLLELGDRWNGIPNRKFSPVTRKRTDISHEKQEVLGALLKSAIKRRN